MKFNGTYILAADDRVVFIGGINSSDIHGNKVDAYTTYEIGSLTKAFMSILHFFRRIPCPQAHEAQHAHFVVFFIRQPFFISSFTHCFQHLSL